MSRAQTGLEPDLEAALTAVEYPQWTDIPVQDVGPAVRLYTSRWLHRLVPTPVAIALALVVGRLRWLDGSRMRRKTTRWARKVLGNDADEQSIYELARAACVEQTMADVLIWRPWALRRAGVRGLEHLLAARATGRGCIVVTAHTKLMNGVSLMLAARGMAPFAPADPVRDPRGYNGLVKVVKKRNGQEAGVRYLNRGGTYGVLRALLDRGETCVMPLDARGTRPTRFGGRTVGLASGVAALALETGATVVPVIALRDGTRLVCTVLAPVDARLYDDAEVLHHQIGSTLFEALLANVAHTFPRSILWSGAQDPPG